MIYCFHYEIDYSIMGEFVDKSPALLVNANEQKESTPLYQLQIHSETDPLRKIALWGPPGPETVLAQLLPGDTNLFYSGFDVSQARSEYSVMQQFLQQKGVEILLVQDLLMNNFTRDRISPKHQPQVPKTVSRLVKDLQDKALVLYLQFAVGDLSSADLIPALVAEDVERLGEEQAILLNWMLSLRHFLPSGNIFYGRDQSNVLGNKMIWSEMRWPIRKPEVGMYKAAFDNVLAPEQNHRVRGKESYLEGGDGIMVDGDIYLGVGGRTNLAGAFQVLEGVQDYLDTNHRGMYLVIDEEAESKTHTQISPGDEQKAMHLDTFWMPFGTGKQVIYSPAEVAKRNIYRAIMKDGRPEVATEGSFSQFMSKRGFEGYEIPEDEQLMYATNFLNVDPKTVVVPFSHNTTTINHLKKQGITVLPVEMSALGGGYGAIHCMTSALVRGY